MDSLIRVFQKYNFTSFLSVYSKLLFSQRLSFPTVFGDFQAAFLQEHVLVLLNMIVYGDIKVFTVLM